MRTLLFFLLVTFVLGGASAGRPAMRRPSLLLIGCIVIGGAYYSYRFVR